MAKEFDLIKAIEKELFMDEELGSLYDKMCLIKDGKLHIDGVIYEIMHGYHGWDMEAPINKLITKWAKSLGAEYFDWETSSIIVPVF